MHNTAFSDTNSPDTSGECGYLDEFVADGGMTLGFRHLEAQQIAPSTGRHGSAKRQMASRRFEGAVQYIDKHLADKITLTDYSAPSKSKPFP